MAEMMHKDWVVPDYVPQELVVDFDVFNPPGVDEDLHLAWRKLHEGPDIVWSPYYGGHWIATRGEDIMNIMADYKHFSNKLFMIPKSTNTRTVTPLSMDPPENRPYRALIAAAFLPKEVLKLEDNVRKVAVEIIEEIAPVGECEFVTSFAAILPIVVFLDIVGLPHDDRPMLLEQANHIVRSNSFEVREQARHLLCAYLGHYIDERMAHPGQDLISRFCQSEIDGRPLTRDEVLSMLELLMTAGFDTTASMLSFIARFLAMNPEHRQQLVDHPELIPNALEELIRRHGLANTARMVIDDMDYKGVHLRKEDQILCPQALAGLDERYVHDPLKVDFNRPRADIKHATFGSGEHTCPGAILARRELAVFLEEWLKRIPIFEIKPGTKPRMAAGSVNGVLELYLSWDPATTRSVAP